jgi:hypothetical protein
MPSCSSRTTWYGPAETWVIYVDTGGVAGNRHRRAVYPACLPTWIASPWMLGVSQGAQQFMARDHIVERAVEHREIHPTSDAERADYRVTAAKRPAVGLVHGDEPFLREGQRVPLRFLVVRH